MAASDYRNGKNSAELAKAAKECENETESEKTTLKQMILHHKSTYTKEILGQRNTMGKAWNE